MILHTLDTLLKTGESTAILGAVSSALDRSDEAPFWRQKSLPFCEAVLSVLIPLREQNLLFDPEGNPHTELTASLFIRWCDLLSLKTLAFTLTKSNEAGRLLRTKIDTDSYQSVDLEILGKYLSSYSVNLSDEWVDFPITNYNLHIGMTSLLTKILEGKC
ncbi:hypothetical protein [Sulfuricurvum sp.]|uniref:hypothetical protein n=1 Tax=Sulfuricurvum sp. TaxID=2025608 RepID=UPI00262E666A|nr:hypothetical protein [Sulfuricurvum sp.]MDD2265276.1 hypothetical protein [Sulfuricurvum sp.]MDD2783761.1 hypothetical protein [Sulfuricurvum sp.]HZF70405.1 hypothetical protein [Sulfuricurvum sp.]